MQYALNMQYTSSRHLPLFYFLKQPDAVSHELLNVLPKNPDNTRKNDYEKIRQNVFPEIKLEEV